MAAPGVEIPHALFIPHGKHQEVTRSILRYSSKHIPTMIRPHSTERCQMYKKEKVICSQVTRLLRWHNGRISVGLARNSMSKPSLCQRIRPQRPKPLKTSFSGAFELPPLARRFRPKSPALVLAMQLPRTHSASRIDRSHGFSAAAPPSKQLVRPCEET